MVLVEWQCPKKDHPLKIIRASKVEHRAEIDANPKLTPDGSVASVVLCEPPDDRVWLCWFCQTPLERLREVPHLHPYAGVMPIIPDAPIVKDAVDKQALF